MSLKKSVMAVLGKQLKTPSNHNCETLFDSFESAMAVCEGGYEKESLITVVHERTKKYRDELTSGKRIVSDFRSLRPLLGVSLARPAARDLNIIEFGGACGADYFLAKALLCNRTGLRWHVVERPSMVKASGDLEDGQLKFYDDVTKAKNDLGRVDIVFTSGALQYVSQPYEILKQLTECEASNFFITRFGLSTLSKELITVQSFHLSENGPPGPMPLGINDDILKVPLTMVRQDKVEEILSKNYRIHLQLNEEKIGYSIGSYSFDMYGYFGLLKSRAN